MYHKHKVKMYVMLRVQILVNYLFIDSFASGHTKRKGLDYYRYLNL